MPTWYTSFCILPRPASSTLFPYTTLFRSYAQCPHPVAQAHVEGNHVAGAKPVRHHRFLLQAGLRVCRSEEHTSELQSHSDLVCRLLLEKKNDHAKYLRRNSD